MSKIKGVRDWAFNSERFPGFSIALHWEKNGSSNNVFVFQDLKWQQKIPILWEYLIPK